MNLDHLSLILLLGIFIVAAAAIWIAGVHLSNTSDVLSKRFGLGQALGGMILLAFVTNLPELAIVVSASLQKNTELAVGNILGGIAIQTVVLVVLDVFGVGKKGSLTSKSASLQLLMEGLLVLGVLCFVIIGRQLPASLIFFRITPSGLLIFFAWIAGLWLVNKAKNGLPWVARNNDDNGKQQDKKSSKDNSSQQSSDDKKKSTGKTVVIFLLAAVVTLVAGYMLEKSGDDISTKIGMQGIIFGATVLATATSLPEISTGLSSIKLKAYSLAVSDIFGGNAFLTVLFLLAAICSGKAVLPTAKNTDIYLTGLAMLLTIVYICGILFKPRKQILRMGIDSFVVLLLYAIGVIGLFAVSQ